MSKTTGKIDYLSMNRAAWDARTGVHIGSKFYDVEGFLAGQTTLKEIELNELTIVEGKKLLHLQCHFGMDTLSWARSGACVTGVDISPAAIAEAEVLKTRTGLEAEFICKDVYEFGESASQEFDVVFTSYGAICWLPDIEHWARVVANSLAPGGTFYMAEFHPMVDLLLDYSYFHQQQPDIETEGTYTDGGESIATELATWGHTLGDVINALVKANIRIELVNEYPFSPYNCFENLEEKEPGRFYWMRGKHPAPLVYSITGTRLAD